MPCRHHDVQVFDDVRCCLACGETVFESTPNFDLSPQHEGAVPYLYAHLNYALGQEIRLVVLFPGRPTDDVAIDIIHANLTDEPTYEAISYAWATQSGDASLSQTVYCRGRTIPVTKHCEAALRSLRRQGRNRTLWVDAISIDQGNIAERNHQVAFMGTIYSNASQVLIYLGPGSEGTDRVLDFLSGDHAALTRIKRDRVNLIVKDFLQQRWLDRVWVLQEIALSKLATMTAGDKTIEWTFQSIKTLLGLCKNLGLDPPSALHWSPASEPDADILTVLHRSRNCSSTDPRDKVFAVLGLARHTFQKEFPVDYSLTLQEVFTKLAVHLIEERRDLAVLKHATGQVIVPNPSVIPSWVPLWNIKAAYTPLPAQFSISELETLYSIWFSPTLLFSPGSSDRPNEKVLNMILEKIPKSETIMSTDSLREWLSHWLEEEGKSINAISLLDTEDLALSLTQLCARDFHFCLSNPHTRQDCDNLTAWEAAYTSSIYTPTKWPCLRIRAHRLDAVRKVIGIRSHNQVFFLSKSAPQAFGHSRRCIHCKSHFVHTPICQVDPSVSRAMLDEFAKDLQNLGQGKALFQTEQSIGFAQSKLCPGDSVWALDGADVPFVLRKVEDHYVLIGECYLYRALRRHPCICCGYDVEPWNMATEIIDIW